jgi:hypothetical protein
MWQAGWGAHRVNKVRQGEREPFHACCDLVEQHPLLATIYRASETVETVACV